MKSVLFRTKNSFKKKIRLGGRGGSFTVSPTREEYVRDKSIGGIRILLGVDFTFEWITPLFSSCGDCESGIVVSVCELIVELCESEWEFSSMLRSLIIVRIPRRRGRRPRDFNGGSEWEWMNEL